LAAVLRREREENPSPKKSRKEDPRSVLRKKRNKKREKMPQMRRRKGPERAPFSPYPGIAVGKGDRGKNRDTVPNRPLEESMGGL